MKGINVKTFKLYCCIILLLSFPAVSSANLFGNDSYYNEADAYTSYPFDDFGGTENDEYYGDYGYVDDFSTAGEQLLSALSEALFFESTDDYYGNVEDEISKARRPGGPPGYEESQPGGTITTPINDGVGVLLLFAFAFLLFKRLKKTFITKESI